MNKQVDVVLRRRWWGPAERGLDVLVAVDRDDAGPRTPSAGAVLIPLGECRASVGRRRERESRAVVEEVAAAPVMARRETTGIARYAARAVDVQVDVVLG